MQHPATIGGSRSGTSRRALQSPADH